MGTVSGTVDTADLHRSLANETGIHKTVQIVPERRSQWDGER